MGGFGSGHGSGGKREGAGRPISTTRATSGTVNIRMDVREIAELKRRAALAGISVTEFIRVRTLGGKDSDDHSPSE